MALEMTRAMTVAEYLEWEAGNIETKHDYIDGEIIDMSGGTADHSIIAFNILLCLGSRVNLQDYVIYTSDMSVQVSESRYVYPDVSIVRGQPIYADASRLNLLNPVFVVEVTSPSTETYDRVDKRDYYWHVPSIEAYLIIDQERVGAELYSRGSSGWQMRAYSSLGAVIVLPPLNCELPLAQVYRGLSFTDERQ